MRTCADDCLKSEWLYHCLRLASRPADLYAHGNQKIVRTQRMTFDLWDDSLTLEDAGYTDKKLSDLQRLYLHDESRQHAIELWRQRDGKYGSVGFHCFAHYKKLSGRSGKQGPCAQSVVVTSLINKVEVNVAYRSTELFKKFPADLVFLRDVLLEPFGVIDSVTLNLTNVTVHPLYFSVLVPHLDDPIRELKDLEGRDPQFHRHVMREAKDLLCGGSSNANFAQAQRVARHALQQTNSDILKKLRIYLRDAS